MQKKFYFPADLDDAVAVVRGTKRLSEALAHKRPLVAYTDRAVATLHGREFLSEGRPAEVPLIVVELSEQLFNELLFGDFTHFGPCAHWRNHHAVELTNHFAEDRFNNEGRFSLEVISE